MPSYQHGGPLQNSYGKVTSALFMLKTGVCEITYNDGQKSKIHSGWDKNWPRFKFVEMIEEWYGSGVSVEFHGKQPKSDPWSI